MRKGNQFKNKKGDATNVQKQKGIFCRDAPRIDVYHGANSRCSFDVHSGDKGSSPR